MELISCHNAHSFTFITRNEPCLMNLRYSNQHNARFNRRRQHKSSSAVSCSINQYNSLVLTDENGQTIEGTKVPSVPKLVIPSLPDKGNGDNVASISSGFWEWKPKFNVYYEVAGLENGEITPILFLPGFGVGSFHYRKQLEDLGRDYKVWALDFLGQGMSLPREDPTSKSEDGTDNSWGFGDESETWAQELVYSVDLWRDQVRYFIEEVIKEPVYLVGNSLGGFVAVYLAAYYPHLVKGVTLLNATPFWGLLPNPERSPRLSKLFPWSGKFPLPSLVRELMHALWMKISDPRTIADILKQVYADHSTNVDDVFCRIVETTRHPAAAASLASIMFAPRGQLSFKEALLRCKTSDTPVCLMYGKQDPWVTPFWGFQVKQQMPNAPYYEINPAGHCPHDEVPEVVNYLLRGWIRKLESNGSFLLPLLGGDEPENTYLGITKELEFVRKGYRRSVEVQFHGSAFSVWDWLMSSYFKPFIQRKVPMKV